MGPLGGPARTGRRVIATFSTDLLDCRRPPVRPLPSTVGAVTPATEIAGAVGVEYSASDRRTCQADTRRERGVADQASDARVGRRSRAHAKFSRCSSVSRVRDAARFGRALRVESFEIVRLVIDVRHRGRDRAVPGALRDQPVHRLRDAPIASDGPAASCAARTDASLRVRSSASRSACGTRARPRTRPGRGNAIDEHVVQRGRTLHRVVEARRRPRRRRRLPARRSRDAGDSVLPLDRQHAVALQVAERAVVAEDVEAVRGALERAARACGGGSSRSPTYACISAMRSSAGQPAHAVEQLRLGQVRVRVTDRGQHLVLAVGIPVERASLRRPSARRSSASKIAGDDDRRCRRGSCEVVGPGAAAVGPVDADEERRDDLAQLVEHQLARRSAPRAAGARACAAAALRRPGRCRRCRRSRASPRAGRRAPCRTPWP